MSEDPGDRDRLVKISMMTHMNTQKQLSKQVKTFEMILMITKMMICEKYMFLWAPACGSQIVIILDYKCMCVPSKFELAKKNFCHLPLNLIICKHKEYREGGRDRSVSYIYIR